MNLLVWSSLLLATLNSLSFGEQLYHREGRFIDLGLHRYKTQLPSIHDIASTFIHYRVPVAVYVPTVRLNIGSRQKRIQYSSFPNSSASPKKAGPPAVQEAAQNKLPEETQPKSNNDPAPSSNLISRTGWTPQARSLSKPKSYYTLSNHKLQRISEQTRRRNSLNYVSSTADSNADLIPFLYKDSLSSQPNLFNSQYQLSNSNPNMFPQNIAYIQPNAVSPFQPNIVMIPVEPLSNGPPAVSNISSPVAGNSTVSVDRERPAASQPTVPVISSGPAEQPPNRPEVIGNSSDLSAGQFDISQVGENPDELPADHVQNHEPLDAVPVNSVDESSSNLTTRANLSEAIVDAVVNSNSNVSNAVNRADDATTSNQPINLVPLVDESSQLEPIQNAGLAVLPYAYRTNFIRRFESNPVYEPKPMRMPKNLVSGRTYRSLPIDMPSMAGLYTAAAAQSGHTSENRRQLFTRFLNENYK